jgi:fibronectin-binding autotransporter adhesin
VRKLQNCRLGFRLNTAKLSRGIAAKAAGALSAAVALIGWTSVSKADTYSNNGGLNLSLPGSWIDDTNPGNTGSSTPGSGDIAQFDNLANLSAPATFNLAGSPSWQGLSVLNPGAAVTIDDPGNESNDTLTLGTSGITVVSQGLTIDDNVSLSSSQNWTVSAGQTLVVNGNISGSGQTLTFAGNGVTSLTAANSYTDATALSGGGTLQLDFSSGAVSSNIVNSGSTLQLGGGNLIINNGSSSASPTQTFNGTTINANGENVITLLSTGTGVPTLNLGAINTAANKGGLIQFNGLATMNSLGPVSAVGTVTLTTSTEGGIIGIGENGPPADYATVGLYDWAAVLNATLTSGGTVSGVVVGGSQDPNFYTVDNTAGAKATPNANDDIQADITQSGTTSTYSMRFDLAGTALTVSVTSGALATGGYLVTPNVGAFNESITSTGSAFTCPSRGSSSSNSSRETVIWQNNPLGELVYSAVFEDGASATGGSASLAIAGTSTTIISGDNTNNGQDYFYSGVALINSNASLGNTNPGTAIPANLFGGTLIGTGTFALDNGSGAKQRPINLGNLGGTLGATTGSTMTVDGVISGSGPLNFGYGTLPGTGTNTANAALAGNGTVALSGTNSYTSATSVNAGLLRVDGLNQSTAPITVASGAGIGGSGTISSNVVVAPNATIVAGDPGSVGTLTVPSLTLGSGDAASFAFGAGFNSMIDVTGKLSLSSLGFDLYGAGTTNPFTSNGTYDVISASNAASLSTSGFSVLNPGLNPNTNASLTYSFSNVGTFLAVTISGGSVSSLWNLTTGGSWGVLGDWSAGIPALAGDTAQFGSKLASSGNITLDGSRTVGNIIFNNSNASYTITEGSGGTLTIDGGINNGAITDLAGTHAFDVPVILNSNTVVTATNSTDSITFNGPISGNGSLTTSGTGTVILSNSSNAYAGSTTINGGNTLELANGGQLPSTTTLTDGGTLAFNSSSNTTFSVAILGSGAVLQSGSGSVLLSGSNAYTGATILNSGTLQIGSATALGAGNVDFTNNAVLDLNGNSYTINSLSGSNGVIDNVSAGGSVTLTFGGSGSSTFGGTIQNSSGTVGLTKSGSGTLELTGANTFAGPTTLNSGELILANSNVLGSTTSVAVGSATTSGGLLLIQNNNAIDTTATITINTTSGAMVQLASGVNLASPIVLNGGSGQSFNVASGSATVSGDINVVSGGTQFRPGTGVGATLYLSATTTVPVNQYVIIPSGAVDLEGTASLSSSNSTGTQFMEIGRGTGAVALIVQDNATLSAIGTNTPGAIGLSVGSGTNSSSDENSSAVLQINGGLVTTGASALNLDGDFSTASAATASTNLTGGDLTVGNFIDTSLQQAYLNLEGGTLTAGAGDNTNGSVLFFPSFNKLTVTMTSNTAINDGGFDITIAQYLSDAGFGAGIDKQGSGTLTLTNSNSYGGQTIIESGALQVDNGGTMGMIGSGSVTDNGSLIFDRSDDTYNVNMTISGSGSLVQAGSGGITLSTANSYTGTTTITQGKLTLTAQGALPTGGTVVNNGTLDVEAPQIAGNISGTGALVIGANSSATLQLTPSTGASSVGSLTIYTGSSLDLTNNSLTINYGSGADPIATIQSYLADGYAGGWTSGELQSSAVASLNASQSKLIYDVGYADGADGITGIPSGEIEILPTLAGDAKMQGDVVFGDFQLLSQYFGQSGTTWDEGDFTYDGTTNFGDFQLLSQNFGQSASGLTSGEIASINGFASQFGEAFVPSGSGYSLVSVPEPASVGLLVAAGLGLMSRRRRRQSR